jgi:hypothetical protein
MKGAKKDGLFLVEAKDFRRSYWLLGISGTTIPKWFLRVVLPLPAIVTTREPVSRLIHSRLRKWKNLRCWTNLSSRGLVHRLTYSDALVENELDPITDRVTAGLAGTPTEVRIKLARIPVTLLALQPGRATDLGQRVIEQCLPDTTAM